MSSAPSPALNVAQIVPRTEAEGPGVRFAVWVQGCTLRCAGCCNPEMFEAAPREAVAPDALAQRALAAGVEGVSLLGGEPFEQAEALAHFARAVRAGGLSVMVFSGYTLGELRARTDAGARALLDATDVLVDGRFEAARASRARRWVGSDNQQVHFLTERYSAMDPRFHAGNELEIRVRAGVVSVNGWPVLGARTLVRGGGT